MSFPFSKYEGLRLIEVWGLPHPNWVLASDAAQIPAVPWVEAPRGWTMRSAPIGGYAFMLPSRHRLEYSEMATAALEMLGAGTTCVAIYPSWAPRVSGVSILGDAGLLIEAVAGPLEPLSRARVTPELSVVFEDPHLTRWADLSGDEALLDRRMLRRLVNPLRRLHIEGEVVLEWVVTDVDEVIYFDWYRS